MVDLQLKESTAQRHMKRVKRLLEDVRESPEFITKKDLRGYLLKIKQEYEPYTYKNWLSSLKRFFRDYLNRKDVVESFRFPEIPFEAKNVPSREDLRTFYEALESDRDKALFLLYASSGLRASELLNLEMVNIDFEQRMLKPSNAPNKTKHAWMTFYNDEAEKALKKYLASRNDRSPRLFTIKRRGVNKMLKRTSSKCGVHLSPQVLREWFCSEMGALGVQDRYVDAFCGRVPKSVLARHYTDYSPERLKRIYNKAGLRVLS